MNMKYAIMIKEKLKTLSTKIMKPLIEYKKALPTLKYNSQEVGFPLFSLRLRPEVQNKKIK